MHTHPTQLKSSPTLVLVSDDERSFDDAATPPLPAAEGLPGTLSETNYSLPPDLSFERWVAIGQTLQQLERSVGFWLGDWWNYGERKWGEISAEALKDATGHERPTIWNYGSVARAIDTSHRRKELSFSHHYEVAKVARADPALADELLDRAVEQKLTREELRDEVKRVTRERALAAPSPPDDRLPADVRLEVADATSLPLGDASVDLIVTSPPYGLDVAYQHGDISPDTWPTFMTAWLAEAYRVNRDGGRLALNVPLDTTKGGCRPTYAEVVQAALDAGWTYRFSIVWNDDTVSKSVARGSLDSPQAVHVMAPVEMIAVFHKGNWRRDPTGRTWDLTHEEWLDLTDGHWTFPGESYPWEGFEAAFPVELPRRLITLLSFHGDVILDPFVGSGTTALAAARLGRPFIGFDISELQVASAKRRLATASRVVTA